VAFVHMLPWPYPRAFKGRRPQCTRQLRTSQRLREISIGDILDLNDLKLFARRRSAPGRRVQSPMVSFQRTSSLGLPANHV